MAKGLKKFSTQVDAEILSAVRTLAKTEGRTFQSLMGEALADLIDKHGIAKPREHVTRAYLASHERYGDLYAKLAN